MYYVKRANHEEGGIFKEVILELKGHLAMTLENLLCALTRRAKVNCSLISTFVVVVMDQLPPLGKRELIYLLLFTYNYVVSVRRGFLFLWVHRIGCIMLLWHSLSLPYDYFPYKQCCKS